MLIQSAVLVYSGFAAYYLKLLKDEKPIEDYAFPCTIFGIMVLASGLLICGHVVENSTKEDGYRPMQGMAARIVWLQQPKIVSDQVFDSYAIFPRHERSVITTSSRRAKVRPAHGSNRRRRQDYEGDTTDND